VSRSPQAVLAGLPGWESASVVELSGGLSNHTWLVEAGQRKAVLKIDDQPRGAPYNTRRAEAQIQARAAAEGLANSVLYVTDTVYMTEYLEGRVWSPADLDDDDKLRRLALALRRLHSLPLTGRLFDAREAAQLYAKRIGDADPERLRHSLRIIEEMPAPQHLCCCHNDLVAGNIIATPEVRFLDWEYACDNDPFFDLATVAAHHNLTTSQRMTLLNAYFDGRGEQWRDQLDRQAEAYDALLYLWEQARVT
jgi:thiamine kinase-like enzyme